MTQPETSQENFCFCDLVPLYVLGALDEVQRRWVEAQIQEEPELATELVEYQAAVATIPYGLARAPMATDLKARLFQRLDLDLPSSVESSHPEAETHLPASVGFTMQADDLNWQPYDYPGVEIARLYRDSTKREISYLVRASAGANYPEHRHDYLEEIVMISGELIMGDRVLHPGDYVRAEANSIHPEATTPQGCLFLLRQALAV